MHIGADNDIITRVLNGEHQLYAELVKRHQNFVFTIALKYAPVREDAEEIAQDVFVKAFKALKDFRGDSKFTTWLYSITNSTSITFLRKKKLDIRSLDNEQVFEVADNQHSGWAPTQWNRNQKWRWWPKPFSCSARTMQKLLHCSIKESNRSTR